MQKTAIGLVVLLFAVVGSLLFRAGESSESDATILTRTLEDSAGRSVEMPKHPKRVVVLNASNLDLFCAAGGAEFVVGKPSSKALSDEVVKATSDADEVGIIHSPNIEKILVLKPDLVIGTNVPYHQALIPTLEQAGIPLYIQALDTYEQIFDTLKLYGSLAKAEQVAEARIEKMKEEYKVAEAYSKGKNPPKSLIIFGSPESFNMATKYSFTGDLVERLGGGNIADQISDNKEGYVPLGMEFVAKQNPQVIFLIMHGPPQMEDTIRRNFEENPAWADVDAVKTKRIFVLPYELFAVNPGVRAAEAMQQLADAMYE